MFRGYRYRLYPTPEQEVLLSKHFGCTRWVYNWALAEKTARYSETGFGVSIYELQFGLTELRNREGTSWLSEVSASSLQSSLRNLDRAFTRFFKGKSAYPNFKHKYGQQSFQVPRLTHIDFKTQKIRLLKFQEGIKGCFNRQFAGTIKTVTVARTPTGKYYASVLVDDALIPPTPSPVKEENAVGLDFGIKDIVVTSSGQRFENPKVFQRYDRRLKIRQRRMERKTKGSNNREKARKRVALIYEKIVFSRKDNLHKISSELVYKNQETTLCIEDLSVSVMLTTSSKGRSLNRLIGDVGWRELRHQIEYKAERVGKNVRVIGKFEPSSKVCSCCGKTKRDLLLSDRTWKCVNCDTVHDRDINAAINIKRFAFCEQNTSSDALASDGYRWVSRKITPVEQPAGAAVNQECSVKNITKHPEIADVRPLIL